MKTVMPKLNDRQSHLPKSDFQGKSRGASFEDNRISSIMQTRLVNQIHNSSGFTIQRLVAIADATPDVGRYVAVHNTLKKFPGHDVVRLSAANLSTMVDGEPLFILGHGSPEMIAGYTPEVMASLLIQKGLKTNTVIDLRACNSATLEVNEDEESGVFIVALPYARRLADEVSKQSGGTIQVTVMGYTGTGVILEDGGYGAKDPALVAKDTTYSKVIKNNRDKILSINATIKVMQDSGITDIDIAKWAAEQSASIFKDLYAANAKVLKDPSVARDIFTTSSEMTLDMIRAILKF